MENHMTSQVLQPNYSRDDITVGIAHFGVGNFHRAHQAVYLHDLFSQGIARDWGVCGIGVLTGDSRMRDALVAENYTYTHVERLANGTAKAQRIASIVDYLFAPDDPEAVLDLLTRPSLRIVSLTITEGGYNTSALTGRFDANNPAIVADLHERAVPATVFGLVTEALSRRRASGIPPFTVMSCDNLQGNGEVARNAFVAFAQLRDPELGNWVAENVSFPNSMVDRITPATSADDREYVAREFESTDTWPVLSESYLQWVLEDTFTLGRPPLELVGVDLVPDVAPYEGMKLRLLNASHQALTYFGLLLGYDFVDQAASDPLVMRLLERYIAEEAAPTLTPIPGFDVASYGATAAERFRNPYIKDTLARIATDASDRVTTFLLPVAFDGVAAGRPTPLTAGIVASWAWFCGWSDRPPEILDRQRNLVDAASAAQQNLPAGFLSEQRFFGALSQSAEFANAFSVTYANITSRGPRDALRALVDGGPSTGPVS
jgi:mannitol 2-dehydrogenase